MRGYRHIAGLIATLVVTSGIDAFADTPSARDEPNVDRPEVRAAADAWSRYTDAARHSADLRLRIAFSLDELVLTADGGATQHELIPLETLIEQARGSSDPLVLSMLFSRCESVYGRGDRCEALDLATRWVDADSQNQLAWLALASVHRDRYEFVAERAAFERASKASRWHDGTRDLAAVIVQSLPRDEAPFTHYETLRRAWGAAASYSPWTAAQIVSGRCKDPPSHDACLRILDTMSRDADSLMTSSIVARLSEQHGVDETVARQRRQRHDAAFWGAMQRASSVPDARTLEAGDSTALGQAIAAYDERTRYSEIEIGLRWLADHEMPPAVAAANYQAMVDEQRRASDARRARLRPIDAALSAGSARWTAASP